MRKIIKTLALVGMISMCAAVSVQAEEEATLYYSDETGEIELIGLDEWATSVEVPEEIDGLPVIGIADQAFEYCTNLTEIYLPDTILSIGENAFSGCSSLTEIEIPDSVESIGYMAFSNCESLTEITIPASVTHIGRGAFIGCTSLKKIRVASGNDAYAVIDGVLFEKKGKILHTYPAGKADTEYTVPKGIKKIGESAFDYCIALQEVTLPETVTSIEESAFNMCLGMRSIKLPETLTEIGDLAFINCALRSELRIPKSVTSIGFFAFNVNTTLLIERDSYALEYLEKYKVGYEGAYGALPDYKFIGEETQKTPENTEIHKRHFFKGAITDLEDESVPIQVENWEDVEQDYREGTPYQKSLLEGHFVIIEEVGLKIFVPDYLEEYELTEEEKEAGFMADYRSEEENFGFMVMYRDFGEEISLPDVAEIVTGEKKEIRPYVVNGLSAANMEMGEDETLSAATAFGTEEGELTLFVFYPIDTEKQMDAAYLMFSSIQEIE